MRLSLQTDYALRTLMYLAHREARATVDEVAGFYGISAAHVAKVVNQLSRLGYARAVRGVGGGVELARRPEDVSVGEVVLAFEGRMNLLDCTAAGDVCAIESFCKLKGVLAEAERLQTEYLRGVTLRDVLPTRRQVQSYERRSGVRKA
jgi:Rrf2 family nitric oxide-sensitive transcriptional repressor